MAKKKKNTGPSDQAIADLLRQHLASSDKSLHALHLATNVSHFHLRRVIRSLPAEFGAYKSTGSVWVKCFQGSAGTQVRLKLAVAVPEAYACQNRTLPVVFWVPQANRGRQNVPENKEFYCSVCNHSSGNASEFQSHNSSARHRVNLLAQQLKSSGSFHANLQGLQVSEFEDVTNLEVGRLSCFQYYPVSMIATM